MGVTEGAISATGAGGRTGNISIRRKVVEKALDVAALLLVTLLAILQLIPLYWMITSSIKVHDFMFSMPPQWFPDPISFLAYRRLFNYQYTGIWFFNTVFVATTATLGNLIVNTTAGYAFAKMKFPGARILFFLVIATMTIPGQVVLIPLYAMMAVELKWLNTYQALILPGIGGAFAIFLMRQFLATLPGGLDGMRRELTGVRRDGFFRHVVVPLAIPALAVLTIFTFIGNWNSFMWPYIMAQGREMFLLQPGLASLIFGGSDYGMMMAGATFSAIPVVTIFLFLQKYFLTGLTLGAIKG